MADSTVPVSGCHVEALSAGEPHVPIGPSALTNAAGMFALDAEFGPGKYAFEVSKGKVTARVPVAIAPSADWYKLLHIALPDAAAGAGTRSTAKEEDGVVVFGQL